MLLASVYSRRFPSIQKDYPRLDDGAHQPPDLFTSLTNRIVTGHVYRRPILEAKAEVGCLQQDLEQIVGARYVVHIHPQAHIVWLQFAKDLGAGGGHTPGIGI